MDRRKTDLDYLVQAYKQAFLKSTDPSSQNGAILVKNNEIIGRGANHFPRNVKNLKERWERPLKYSYVEHAERNAIFDAARRGNSTEGAILYCPWFACTDCGRAIIQTGIKRCVGHSVDDKCSNSERWKESIIIALQMFDEAGVEYEFLDYNFGYKIKRGEELIDV